LVDFVELRYRYVDRQINPVDGPPYAIEKTLVEVKSGDVVFFTDPRGWTIARLELTTDVADTTLTVRVVEEEGLDGINRRWTFDVDGDAVTGELSLYYRNTPSENWYPELEAIGRQWRLAITQVRDGGAQESLDSTVNPYSNRVRAEVSLDGEHQFLLLRR
ncbi:MAG: hypothetical protein ACNA8W_10635, partial [Bradymonadaceae bacterium]